MEHSFDIDIATKYGITEAILLNNIYWWIEKNRANDTNYYDGNYWTYNSTKAFSELFPYLSQRKIQNALKHLIDEGILLTGNYNKSAYDRTLWYAFTEKGKCIMQKREMEDTEMQNGSCKNVQPIPDINTDSKTTDINTDSKPTKKALPFYALINEYTDNEELREALRFFVNMRLDNKRDSFTERALLLGMNKLTKMSSDENVRVAIVNQSVERGWKGFFELKNEYQNSNNQNGIYTLKNGAQTSNPFIAMLDEIGDDENGDIPFY